MNRDIDQEINDAIKPDDTVKQVDFGNLTQKELHEIFSKVQNPKDWKASINTTIDASSKENVKHAIVFMTGTKPNFTEFGTEDKMTVTAIGYRNGPSGDY